MEFDEVLVKRRSIRKYMNIPVEKEKWAQIVQAAGFAPSCGNLQNWKCVVVRDAVMIKRLASICHDQSWIEQASLCLVMSVDSKLANQFYGVRGERLYSVQNCAAAIENMLLKATDLGLAACWVSAFDEQRLKVALNIPEHVRPQAIIPIGYPDEVVPTPPKRDAREYCYFEKYGNEHTDNSRDLEWLNYGRLFDRQKRNVKKFFSDITDKLKKTSKK